MSVHRPKTPAPSRRAAIARGYDLLTKPWVPCIGPGGQPKVVGLIDALVRAHELRAVRDASPVVTYGLYRLLLALALDLFAPRGKAEWLALFRPGRFDRASLLQFRDRYADRFDLFHPTRPFYQSGNSSLNVEDGVGPADK